MVFITTLNKLETVVRSYTWKLQLGRNPEEKINGRWENSELKTSSPHTLMRNLCSHFELDEFVRNNKEGGITQKLIVGMTNLYCWTWKHILFLMFIFERERQCASRGGAEREGDTESEAGSRFRAVSTEPDTGLEPWNHDPRRSGMLNWLSHPGVSMKYS